MSSTTTKDIRESFVSGMDSLVAELRGKRCMDAAKNGAPFFPRLLAAVSGGSDSMALLHLLKPWCDERGAWLGVIHFNHCLRGDASDGDESHVRDTAESLGLPFFRGSPSTPLAELGGSLEQTARAARLDFFARIADETHADAICTGHTRDDVAETLILRLLRGGGASGLSGLRAIREFPSSGRAKNGAQLFFIRPVLPFSHDELRGLLSKQGLVWREDASNDDTAIPRNRARHRILPAIAGAAGETDASIRSALARSARILQADDELLESLATDAYRDMASQGDASAIPIAGLLSQPLALQRRIVRIWLRAAGGEVGFDAVERILALLEARAGGCVEVSQALRIHRDADALRIEIVSQCDPVMPGEKALAIPGEIEWNGYLIRAEAATGIVRDEGPIGHIPAECSLAFEAVERAGGLLVRTRRDGDRMAPLGMAGSKKLQDILVDGGVPHCLRDSLPVICAANGEIAWLPGYRISRGFALKDPRGKCVRIAISLTESF